MDFVGIIVALVVGLILGGAGTWFLVVKGLKSSIEESQEAVKAAQEEVRKTSESRIEDLAELNKLRGEKEQFETRLNESREEMRENFRQREQDLKEREEQLEERLKGAFENLSNQALRSQMDDFLKRSQEQLEKYEDGAKEMSGQQKQELEKILGPMRERLEELDQQNRSMEVKRAGAYGELIEQIKSLGEEQTGLRRETTRLVKALQAPGTAGQWGEMVLQQVVEMAGLEKHVNFETQSSSTTEEGRQRPDMHISLPGDRVLIVDSKAPMKQYLEGLESEDQNTREVLFREHAKKVYEHARVLGGRKYTGGTETPDFTIMFVPSESAFRVAMEARPALLEEAMSSNVVIATPSTMLALLRAVAYGWRQEKLAKEAVEVQKMGQELYDRICTVMDHYNRAARSMNSASDALNKMGRSLETRVLPSARRFKDAGVETTKELPERAVVESHVQEMATADSGEDVRSALPGLDD